jgi:hypothetical protein
MSIDRPRFAGFLSFVAPCVLFVAGTADSAARNLEAWVSGELADYVLVQLTTVPRFHTATVQLVVFSDGQPAPRSNELSLWLRDQLRRSLAGRSGVSLGWQPDPDVPLPTTAEQCDAMRPELLLGIEVRSDGRDQATVSLRARDESEQRWVPGFGREWQGELTAAQRRAFASPAADRAYLGRRDVPYGPSETDLIANHLARDLRCQLMRQVTGEYRLAAAGAPDDGDALAAVPSLVRHQVLGVSSLRLLASPQEANAELSGQLHPVAGGLHLYWLILDPLASTPGLQPLSSSVYVELPFAAPADAPTEARTVSLSEREPLMPSPTSAVLSDLRLVRLAGDPSCVRAGPTPYLDTRYRGSERCMALRVTAARDAVVFIVNHQQSLGLVRLGDERCEPRARAHVLRRGHSLTVPVPDLVPVDDTEWAAVATWSMTPAGEVWYAIAADDSAAARAIATHLAALPARCSASARPGLDGAALAHWFRGFSAELERRAADVDWRAVQTRNVL